MSYQDPYAHGQYGQQQYQDAPFNPYEVQHQHGYAEPTERYADGVYDYAGAAKEAPRSGFEDDVVPPPLGEKYVCSPLMHPTDNSCEICVHRTPGNVRRWRKEYQGNLWTKGSRLGCFGRFFCCTLMIFLFLLISIVLSLALVGFSFISVDRTEVHMPVHFSGSAHLTSSSGNPPST